MLLCDSRPSECACYQQYVVTCQSVRQATWQYDTLQHTADAQTVSDLDWWGNGAVRRETLSGLRAKSKFETPRTGNRHAKRDTTAFISATWTQVTRTTSFRVRPAAVSHLHA